MNIAGVTNDYLQRYRDHNHGRFKIWVWSENQNDAESNKERFQKIPLPQSPAKIQTDQNSNHTTIITPMGQGDGNKGGTIPRYETNLLTTRKA